MARRLPAGGGGGRERVAAAGGGKWESGGGAARGWGGRSGPRDGKRGERYGSWDGKRETTRPAGVGEDGGGSAPLPAQTRASAPLLPARGPAHLAAAPSTSATLPRGRKAAVRARPPDRQAPRLPCRGPCAQLVRKTSKSKLNGARTGPRASPPGPRRPGSGPHPKAGRPARLGPSRSRPA